MLKSRNGYTGILVEIGLPIAVYLCNSATLTKPSGNQKLYAQTLVVDLPPMEAARVLAGVDGTDITTNTDNSSA